MAVGRNPATVGVTTALWRRPAISRAVLEHYAALRRGGVLSHLVAARSPEDPDPTPDVDGWEYVEAPNEPLSDKWNAAVAALRGRVDAVMIVGSDDLVDASYVRHAMALARDRSMIRPSWLYFVDAVGGEAVVAKPKRMGAGRIITAGTLDEVDWQLWEPGRDRHLDQSMDRRLLALPGGMHQRQASGVVVDIKSEVNLWGWDHVPRMGTKGPADALALMTRHFPLALSHLQAEDILTPDAMAKAQAKKAAEGDKAPTGTTRLVAEMNIPASMTGTGKRVFAGKTFDAPRAFVKALVRGGIAKEA